MLICKIPICCKLLLMSKVPVALTIAGSDSSGGAGIQADIKTFTAFKVYGASAITAITSQNTLGIESITELPEDIVQSQIEVVVRDIGCDSVKIGMLLSPSLVKAVAKKLKEFSLERIVVDPVMFSKNGCNLLRKEAVPVFENTIIPLATLLTPNIVEAEIFSGMKIKNLEDMKKAAEKIKTLGCKNVLIKGGHLEGRFAIDVLFDGYSFKEFVEEKIETKNTHGTGCTYSSAICAGLAKGWSLVEAINTAKHYITGAIRNSLDLGKGQGPLNHFWEI